MKISENIQVNSTTYNGGLLFLMFEMEQIKSVESHQGWELEIVDTNGRVSN